jgi:hypothetical protein
MARWPIPADLHSRIIQGPLCPHQAHSLGSIDGQIPRYDDSHACVRCIASLAEGRLDLSIRAIHPRWRRRFLEFWSLVDIGAADECWLWQGPRYRDGSSSYFPVERHWSASRQFAPARIATWFTWGDIGGFPLSTSAVRSSAATPLHIRIRGVPHFTTAASSRLWRSPHGPAG